MKPLLGMARGSADGTCTLVCLCALHVVDCFQNRGEILMASITHWQVGQIEPICSICSKHLILAFLIKNILFNKIFTLGKSQLFFYTFAVHPTSHPVGFSSDLTSQDELSRRTVKLWPFRDGKRWMQRIFVWWRKTIWGLDLTLIRVELGRFALPIKESSS